MIPLRRSIGFIALPFMFFVVVVNIFGHSRPWVHEWQWAVYNYHFVTVLLGPVVAGLAAWEGRRLAVARDLILSSGRGSAAGMSFWLALMTWVTVCYFAGLVTVVVWVKAAGTPGWPGVGESVTILPPLALLAAETAVGFYAGWRFRSAIVAPAVAVICFALTIFFYVNGPGNLIIVGGATDSLVGLQPRLARQAAQVAFYLSLALVAMLMISSDGVPRALWSRASGSVVLSVTLLAVLLALGPEIFDRVEADVTCYGSAPAICVAPGYAEQVSAVRSAVSPYISALDAAGVPVPPRFDQNADTGDPRAGVLPVGLLLGDRSSALPSVLSWYIAPWCDVIATEDTLTAFQGLYYWLEGEVSGSWPPDPTVPDVLRHGTSAERGEWASKAIVVLRDCGG